MLPVNLLQLTDSRCLISNAVGAVCFVTAYNVSKAFSRAAVHAEEQLQKVAGHDQDDLLYSQLQSTDQFESTLWNLRMSITQEMRARGQTVCTPPHRLLAQELQGDMPLYMDEKTKTWTWLEPFKLEPEIQALLQRFATSQAQKPSPSPVPATRRGTVIWSPVPGSSVFKRAEETPALSSTLVHLPLGEYCALPAELPFYGLGPRSATKAVLTKDGWTRGGTASISGRPSVCDSEADDTARPGARNAARQEPASVAPFTASPSDSAYPLFPSTNSSPPELRGFFEPTSLSPPPTLPRKRKSVHTAADDAGPSKAARTDNAPSSSVARSQLSAPPVTPPSLPRRSSPPGAPRRRRPGPLSPLPTLQAEMRSSPFMWTSIPHFFFPPGQAEAFPRP